MRLLNRPGVGIAPFASRVEYPDHSVTIVAKAALRLKHDGVAEVVEDPPPYPSGDVPFEDAGLDAAPRYEGDWAPLKERGEALVAGHFHAPRGRPIQQGRARIEVGDSRLTLDVLGRRVWNFGLLGASFDEPETFESVPLRWESCFGGPEFPANPVGIGHVTKARRKDGQPIELPRIENPDERIVGPKDLPRPVCSVPLGRTWKDRGDLLGTFDDRWQKTRWPWFPEDFDWGHFQAAVPALQARRYLSGDETLFFRNLHPEHPEYETRLPGLSAIAAVQRTDARDPSRTIVEPVTMNLDTLWVDMDTETAVLLWRGWCPIADEDMSDLSYVWGDVRKFDHDPGERGVRDAMLAAIAADEAEWAIEEEAPPPDEVEETPEEPEDEAETPLPPEIAAAMAKVAAAGGGAAATPEPTPESLAVLDPYRAAAEAKIAEIEQQSEDEAAEDDEPVWDRERVRETLAGGGSVAGEDLSGIDLSGEDLSEVALTGTVLARAILRGATLRNADLSDADLEGADLTDADLTDARCVGATFANTEGKGLRAGGADLELAVLDGARWDGVLLSRARLVGASAIGASCASADLRESDLTEATFDDADLGGADLTGATAGDAGFNRTDLGRARLTGARLGGADFTEATLTASTLDDADLTDATLEACRAEGASLTGANVKGIRAAEAHLDRAVLERIEGADPIFEGASLTSASFRYARIPGAEFSGARLSEADLSACDLRGARFAKADLERSTLTESDCFEAIFAGARMDGCDGSGSNFYAAEFLDADVRGFRGRKRNLVLTKLADTEEGSS